VVAQRLKWYAMSRKVVGSGRDEVNKLYQFTPSFPPYKALKFTKLIGGMRTRNRKVIFVGSKMAADT
jgi:hypothetical protein